MGNGFTRLAHCLFASPPLRRRRRQRQRQRHVLPSDAFSHDDSLGHSFCYIAPASASAFRSISGAAVSANASTPLSTSLRNSNSTSDSSPSSSSSSSSSFQSSLSFASVPLHPFSGPLPSHRPFMSAPLDHASFLSGPFTLTNASSKHTATPTTHSPLQWAQGTAGEDRVHVVLSEEHGWLFVGIYDGFNGPDATHFLLTHLYPLIHLQLKGILWQEPPTEQSEEMHKRPSNKRKFKSRDSNATANSSSNTKARNVEVLKALSRALSKAEDAFLSIAHNMLHDNPELALMGSCVLVMLIKGEDVYLMNVGDSRAVLASTVGRELEGISEDLLNDYSGFLPTLSPLQLTFDHCTSAEEELIRIRNEHPDDPTAITNGRVKGSLKVTRAFGAGFLKQPKLNNALLEMFRIDYVGTAPYITCHPSLYHYRVGPKDKFLILSSDGLYQYLTNTEAVTQVEMFLSTSPDGDPAQHLVEELLFRAAAKAGMELHELLEIPQGDRRRYYDDVSIIVISLEGRIWRSFV